MPAEVIAGVRALATGRDYEMDAQRRGAGRRSMGDVDDYEDEEDEEEEYDDEEEDGLDGLEIDLEDLMQESTKDKEGSVVNALKRSIAAAATNKHAPAAADDDVEEEEDGDDVLDGLEIDLEDLLKATEQDADGSVAHALSKSITAGAVARGQARASPRALDELPTTFVKAKVRTWYQSMS